MKKTFLLKDPKKDSQRVLESVKSNIKKYIKREKRKDLPEGSNFWKIDCKFGKDEKSAVEIRFEDIMKNISEASSENLDSFYIELTSEASTMKFKKNEPRKVKEENEEEISTEVDSETEIQTPTTEN